MSWLILRAFRRAWIMLGLIIAAALSLGFATSANAAKSKEVISASFDPKAGVLTISGDNLSNNITVSRDAAGAILINGGAVRIKGGTPTVANTGQIQVFGRDGDDMLALDEANGVLPKANISGGAGNDTLIGGSSDDQLSGDADNDTLLGKAGVDAIAGGAGNDTINGGAGNDLVLSGGDGDDTFVWNPGDDSDVLEGDAGSDRLQVNGGNGSETFTIAPNGSRVRVDRINPAPFTLDLGGIEAVELAGNGGDDTISGSPGLATLIQLTVDGGAGNDTITGGDGNDMLLGGDGNDLITPSRGNDVALMGDGDDTFVWNPGDSNDTIEGQAGSDTMLFNGSNISENIGISANGGRVRFFRDVANVTMDLDDVERVDFNALGGADTITVNDLSGTDLTRANINLAAAGGGDAQPDNVIVNGTNGDDVIQVAGDANGTAVLGLAGQVNITGAEAANDRLTVNALAGDDVVEASGLAAGAIQLTADGGDGADVLIGGAGNDTLLGGAGDDVLQGGPGIDVLDGGSGNNILIQD